MNNTDEKTVHTIELDDKAKELIERIRQMNRKELDEEAKKYEEIAEKLVREELEEKYGPEADKTNISSDYIFDILDVYDVDSDISKISVNSIIDKVLMYTEINYAYNLEGKEDYGYRDIAAYKDLIATITYRSSDSSIADKSITDKEIKQKGNGVKIANNTITGLIIYLIFIAKSDRFYEYHKLYKSKTEHCLKEYEWLIFERFFEKVAGYVNLKNMCYTEALDCFDIWPKLTLALELYQRKIKSGNVSFDNGQKLGEAIEKLDCLHKQCTNVMKDLLHFNISISEYKHMTLIEWKELKIELLCKSLINAATETIGEYEKAAICEEKELLLQELSPISSNPGLKDYIDKTTKGQRAFLFDKLYEFRSMIDQKISSKK